MHNDLPHCWKILHIDDNIIWEIFWLEFNENSDQLRNSVYFKLFFNFIIFWTLNYTPTGKFFELHSSAENIKRRECSGRVIEQGLVQGQSWRSK